MSSDTTNTTADELDTNALRPVVRDGLIVLGLLGFIILWSILPGTGREFPRTGVAVTDLVLGIGTLGLVATFLHAAPRLRRFVEVGLDGPAEVVATAAPIVQYLVVFVAILVAYSGLAPTLAPVIDVPWAYDLAFLLFALVPLGLIAYRFYGGLEPLVAFLTEAVSGEHEESPEGAALGATNGPDPGQ